MGPIRVLFLATDSLTASVRIQPLLDELTSSGLVRYAVVDRNMALDGVACEKYDALVTHRNLSRRQFGWLRRQKIPFIYDIDDLLLQDRKQNSRWRHAAQQAGISWCLEHAFRVTSPSHRLLTNLNQTSRGALTAKSVFLPNAGSETPPPRKPFGVPRLLWVSSALPMHAADLDEVCLGIGDAVGALKTDIVLVGRFPDRMRDMFSSCQAFEWLDPAVYLRLLAEGPYIAVAPISQQLSALDQAFADCKSDIKIAQFGSNRIAGAYSPAAPYLESDLPRRIVAKNARADWADAIKQLAENYPDEGNDLAEHPAFARRRPSILARQFRDVISELVRVTEPFRFQALPTPDLGRQLEQRFRKWRADRRK